MATKTSKPKVDLSSSGLTRITSGNNHFSYIPKCEPRNERELEAWLKRTSEEIEAHHIAVKYQATSYYGELRHKLEEKKNKPKSQTIGEQNAQI